ncbi:cystathionine gamma-lyase [Trichonephila clavata]|uniref:cystathionine gamma-lyase n=1 Tax=Trichonephila clavata TaxID=2740835 RepID=A0A8X6KA99_TRICU|nr:cystathionine gamma-lyase [Trichonephila clavata]
MAAMTSISMLIEDGDHVVTFDSVYHGTRTYLNIREKLGKVETTFADLRDPSELEKLMKPNTKMVWIEHK